jgi:hypothetical protein
MAQMGRGAQPFKTSTQNLSTSVFLPVTRRPQQSYRRWYNLQDVPMATDIDISVNPKKACETKMA